MRTGPSTEKPLPPLPPRASESFLSFSPTPVDVEVDSPVITSPAARQFLHPYRAAAMNMRPPQNQKKPNARSSPSVSRNQITAGERSDMQNDWRKMVDDFMDIQED